MGSREWGNPTANCAFLLPTPYSLVSDPEGQTPMRASGTAPRGGGTAVHPVPLASLEAARDEGGPRAKRGGMLYR